MSAPLEVSAEEIEIADIVEDARLLKHKLRRLSFRLDGALQAKHALTLARVLWEQLVALEKHAQEAG